MSLFLSRAMTDGRAAGFACMFGASSGIVVHTMAAAFGLSALLAASAQLFSLVKLAGAGYLIWLAVQAVRHGSALRLVAGAPKNRTLLEHWLTGVGINLLNPKIVLFFVTFLPQFISAGDPRAAGKLVFLGLYFLALAIPITSLMILAADRFAAAFKSNPRLMKWIDWLFAGMFSAFAVKILLTRGS
jgi:threonine/homoserine/homoserine lactone efflux protein